MPEPTIFDDPTLLDEDEEEKGLLSKLASDIANFFTSPSSEGGEFLTGRSRGMISPIGPTPPEPRATRSAIEGAADAPLALGAGVLDLVGADDTAEKARQLEILGFLPGEADVPIARAGGRILGEIGTMVGGAGALGAALRGAGNIGRLGRVGQALAKAGRAGGVPGELARFAPIDALFGASEETSGAKAIADLTGAERLSEALAGDDPGSTLLRMAAEASMGLIPAIGLSAGGKAIRSLRSGTEEPVLRSVDNLEFVETGDEFMNSLVNGRVRSAIRTPDGKVYPALDPIGLEGGNRRHHFNILQDYDLDTEVLPHSEDGFIVDGEFLRRDEMGQRMREAGLPPEYFDESKALSDLVDDIRVIGPEFVLGDVDRYLALGQEGAEEVAETGDEFLDALVNGEVKSAVRKGDGTVLEAPDPLGVDGSTSHLAVITNSDEDLFGAALESAEDGFTVSGEFVPRSYVDNKMKELGLTDVPGESTNLTGLAKDIRERGADEVLGEVEEVAGEFPEDMSQFEMRSVTPRGVSEDEYVGAFEEVATGAYPREAAEDADKFVEESIERGFLGRLGGDEAGEASTDAAKTIARAAARTVGGAFGGEFAGSAIPATMEATLEVIPGVDDVDIPRLPPGIGGIAGGLLALGGPKTMRIMADKLGDSGKASPEVGLVGKREQDRMEELLSLEDPSQIGRPGPVEDVVRKVLPKELDEEEVALRVVKHLEISPGQEARVARQAGETLESGRLKEHAAARVTDEAAGEAAEGLSLGQVMQKRVGTLTDVEVVRLRRGASNYSKELLRFDELLSRVQGSVSQERWNTLLRVREAIEEGAQDVFARVLNEGSEKGRQLRQFGMLVPEGVGIEINNIGAWELRARRMAGGKFFSEDRAQLAGILEGGDRQMLQDFMMEMAGRNVNIGAKVADAIRNGLLTQPQTDLVNVGSTMSHIAIRKLESPVASVFDRLLSKVTGQRSISLDKFDSGFARIDPESGDVVMTEGVKNMVQEMGNTMARAFDSGNTEVLNVLKKMDFRGYRTGNLALDTYFKIGFHRLGAEDAAMKGYAFFGSLHERARVAGLNAGKTGEELRQFVAREMADPDEELVIKAAADAEEATFTNQSDFGAVVNAMKSRMRANGSFQAMVAEFTVPFANTLVNVAGSFFARTPVMGVFKEDIAESAVDLVRHLKGGEQISQESQRVLSQMFARQAQSAVGLSAFGYWMRSQGLMTGSWPDDTDARQVFRQTNIQPFALKLPGGGTVSIESFSPAGNVIAYGAQLHDLVEDPDINDWEVATGAVAAFFKQLGDVSFLSNANTMLDAVARPERSQGAFDNLGRMLVPSIVSATARSGLPIVGDPTFRRKNIPAVDAFRASVPGLSRTLEPQIDPVTGEPRERVPLDIPLVEGDLESLANWVEDISNPWRLERPRKHPVIQEMARLQVGVPQLTTVERRDVKGEERTRLESIYGKTLLKRLDHIVGHPGYESATDVEKREFLESEISRVRTATTNALEESGELPEQIEGRFIDPFLREGFGPTNLQNRATQKEGGGTIFDPDTGGGGTIFDP